jgi:general secretion pathway protein C
MASTLRGGLQSRWTVRSTTFVLWTLAALSTVYWGLKMASSSSDTPSVPPVVRAPAADPVAVGRLLGAQPQAAATTPAGNLAGRFVLTGVVASDSGGGAALIAVDGKPPRPYRVGARVDEGLVLQSVQGRRALIGASPEGPTTVTLELPPLQH